MTREKAKREIDSLDFYLQNHTDDYSEESHTAMMMAIKSLEQEPILDKIRAEIDEQYDKVHPYNLSCAEGLEMALGIIDKYNAESEKKEEISKDDAIKIVHDTIKDFFDDSETFNDKDKFLLKINKAICNNIMGY